MAAGANASGRSQSTEEGSFMGKAGLLQEEGTEKSVSASGQ
jgi:hypothetical protein